MKTSIVENFVNNFFLRNNDIYKNILYFCNVNITYKSLKYGQKRIHK